MQQNNEASPRAKRETVLAFGLKYLHVGVNTGVRTSCKYLCVAVSLPAHLSIRRLLERFCVQVHRNRLHH